MSLAENLLNSLGGTSYQNPATAGSGQEEHIRVGQDRVITVPNALKNIAVKGDKDIETVTFDCVRYWDGHDLSTFAIYINYILPNGDEGTYIPESITRSEDVFSFDWEIGSEITYVQGKLTFWIVTKLTDDSGVLIKQWSSFQNSDCTIAEGGDKTYVPSQTQQDVISQAISISRASAERAEEQANIATEAAEKAASDAKSAAEEEVARLVGELGVVQETGISPTSVISQAGATRSFAHALNGKESGGAVLCEEVSPVLHPVVVGVRRFNLIPYFTTTTLVTTDGLNIHVSANTEILTVDGTTTRPDGRLQVKPYCKPVTLTGGKTYNFRANGEARGTAYLSAENNDDIVQTVIGEGSTIYKPENDIVLYYGVNFDEGTYAGEGVYASLTEGEGEEPYVAPATDGTAVTLSSRGENLFSPPVKGVSLNPSNGSEGQASDSATTDYIPVHTGDGDYCIAGLPNNLWYFIAFYDSNKNFINRTGAGPNVSTYESLVDLAGEANVDTSRISYIRITIYETDNTDGNISSIDNCQLMMNRGTTPEPYTPFIAGQTIDTTVGSTIDLPSIAPYMSVYTNTEGTAVDVTYIKDTNAVVQKLVNAIVALGGNV